MKKWQWHFQCQTTASFPKIYHRSSLFAKLAKKIKMAKLAQKESDTINWTNCKKNKRNDNFQTNWSMNNYLLNSYQYLQKGHFTPFPAVFFFSSSMELDHFLIKLLFIRRIRTGVTKKHQNFIFEYWVFSQKSYLNVWSFVKVHICIPKIPYLHT